ncbi:MAG: GAF domain-containing protein, partial [Acidimicrobiia bacterium]|nr:GAF domain-containing protein [Acidimicrobiia bacterium]
MTQFEEVAQANRLLECVTRAQALYFRDADPSELFNGLLVDLLDLTASDYGYIAEVLYDDEGAPYLKTWAITNIAWNDATRELYEQHVAAGEGLEFRNLDTLFGWGLRDGGRVVIANDPASDPHSSGRPDGHPPLDSYLAGPIFRGSTLVGQFGVANRAGGFDEGIVESLRPFTVAVGNLIDAYRADKERREAERERTNSEQRLAAIVEHLSDVVTVLDADGSWVSSSPAGSRLLGYDRGVDPPGGIFALLHPDDVDLARQALAEVMA